MRTSRCVAAVSAGLAVVLVCSIGVARLHGLHVEHGGVVNWATHVAWAAMQEPVYSTCNEVPFSRYREDGVLESYCRGKTKYKLGWSGQYAYRHASSDQRVPGAPAGTEPWVDGKPFPHFVSGGSAKRVVVPAYASYAYATCDDPTYGMLLNLHETLQRNEVLVQANAKKLSEWNKLLQLLPNVMLLWIDAVSHARFLRRLPLTAAFLHGLLRQSETGAWEGGVFYFNRYGVVGINSWPNSAALFCNVTVTGTKNAFDYLAQKHAANPAYVAGHADDEFAQCLWNTYKQQYGYVTAFIRGDCDMRHFQPLFRVAPAWVGPDIDAGYGFCDPDYTPSGRTRCVVGRQAHDRSFAYAEQLLDAYAARNRSSRAPVFGGVSVLDFHFEQQLRVHEDLDVKLRASLQRMLLKHGSSTMFVLYSDHGLHFGPYRREHVGGSREHRLPFLYILVPPAVLKACPDVAARLRANRDVATSPFDIYSMLQRLPTLLEACVAHGGTIPDSEPFAGLLSKLPVGRTCEAAGIPHEWCEAEVFAPEAMQRYIDEHPEITDDMV